MKKVCVITTAHPAEDNRIFRKEVQTLLEKYEVTYITTSKLSETEDNLEVVSLGYFAGSLKKRIAINWKAFREAMRRDVSAYHFHDFDFIFLAVLLKLLKRRPVIYDVHEDYPAVVLSRGYVRSRTISRALSRVVRLVESFCCLFFDGALVVNQSIRDRISKRIPRTFVLPNYPKITEFPGLKWNGDSTTLVHLGNLNKIRGAEIVFAALEELESTLTLKVIGTINPTDYEEDLKKRFPNVRVEVTGQLPYREALRSASTGMAGIIGYLPVPNHSDASPNKIFEYMALGLPVLASDLPAFKGVVGDAGILYQAEVPQDLAKAIKKISDTKLRDKLSDNGREYFKKLYNWEVVSINLTKLYEQIIKK